MSAFQKMLSSGGVSGCAAEHQEGFGFLPKDSEFIVRRVGGKLLVGLCFNVRVNANGNVCVHAFRFGDLGESLKGFLWFNIYLCDVGIAGGLETHPVSVRIQGSYACHRHS